MFTPQEVQEKTFVKVVFGGYDMTSVDEYLEPLSNDYIALYKENSVLKSKMKILVEKLEEYRAQEETMKKTMVAATEAAEKLKTETERKCAQMMLQAENAARNKASEAAQQVAAEEERIERAKQTAGNFIGILEREIGRHLEQLKTLKGMDLSLRTYRPRAYDYESELPQESENPRQIAEEIESNLEKMIGPSKEAPLLPTSQQPAKKPEPEPEREPEEENQEREKPAPEPEMQETVRIPQVAAPKPMATQATIKFSDLQFGKNYDPNRQS